MTDIGIILLNVDIQFSTIHLIDDGFLFLYGPLLFLYVNRALNQHYKISWKHAFHFIPVILFYLFLIFYTKNLLSGHHIASSVQFKNLEHVSWVRYFSLAIYLVLLSYLWYCGKTIENFNIMVKDSYLPRTVEKLNWLKYIIRSFTVITVIALTNSIIPIFGNFIFLLSSLALLVIFTFFFVNRLLVKALDHSAIFSELHELSEKKYAGSNLSALELEKHKTRLISFLENEKPYLNPELTLKDLADQLRVSSKILSQVINQSFNLHFYDLINSYRCEEVKSIIRQSNKSTISEAMYKSGFNSKSSFNKEFKKLTGQTPSEFKKSQNSH